MACALGAVAAAEGAFGATAGPGAMIATVSRVAWIPTAALFVLHAAGCGDAKTGETDGDCTGVRSVFRDGDGDGVGQDSLEICGDAVVPSGYVTQSGDCDDGNPAVFQPAYVDADGDGTGAPGTTACVGPLPAGYSLVRTPVPDCNDNDPSVSPLVLEQWGDRLDSDCNGAADPAGCVDGTASAPYGCSCGAFAETVTVGTDPACAAVDLVLLEEVIQCLPTCGISDLYVRIGNRGNAPFSGVVRLDLDRVGADPPASSSVTVSIAPGASTIPIHAPVSFGQGTLLLTHDGADCDPSNQQIADSWVNRECG